MQQPARDPDYDQNAAVRANDIPETMQVTRVTLTADGLQPTALQSQ